MKWIIPVLFFAVLITSCEKKREVKQVPKANDLPAMMITTTKAQPIFAKNLSGKTILVLFQPDCDHCQREAKQMRDKLQSFKAYQLYFVSTAMPADLEKFSIDYQFSGEPNVHFATTTLDQILGSFGAIEAPSLFVYSAEGKLIKHFNGEVDISEILKVL